MCLIRTGRKWTFSFVWVWILDCCTPQKTFIDIYTYYYYHYSDINIYYTASLLGYWLGVGVLVVLCSPGVPS